MSVFTKKRVVAIRCTSLLNLYRVRFCTTGMVFSGSVTPVLNKLLTASNFGLTPSGDAKMTMPSIVRVEPWGKSQQLPPAPEELSEGVTEQVQEVVGEVDANGSEIAITSATEIPSVGDMVARKYENSIFRGVIDEVRANSIVCRCARLILISAFQTSV